jgi:hypothetical protein
MSTSTVVSLIVFWDYACWMASNRQRSYVPACVSEWILMTARPVALSGKVSYCSWIRFGLGGQRKQLVFSGEGVKAFVLTEKETGS